MVARHHPTTVVRIFGAAWLIAGCCAQTVSSTPSAADAALPADEALVDVAVNDTLDERGSRDAALDASTDIARDVPRDVGNDVAMETGSDVRDDPPLDLGVVDSGGDVPDVDLGAVDSGGDVPDVDLGAVDSGGDVPDVAIDACAPVDEVHLTCAARQECMTCLSCFCLMEARATWGAGWPSRRSEGGACHAWLVCDESCECNFACLERCASRHISDPRCESANALWTACADAHCADSCF